MTKHDLQLFPIVVSVGVLILISFPYLLAYSVGGEDLHFGGFLLNPLDGNSYLAKMHQGMEGSWQFKLPFTPEPGEGAYLFLFYLVLGHLARVSNLPNLLIFHLARILGSVLLLWSLWYFWGGIFTNHRTRKLAFGLSTLGSGSGWLMMASGSLTADFWVAEAYPFLSAYTNPHFPLGLALVLWLIRPQVGTRIGWKKWATSALIALLISMINPFGIVISLLVLGGEGVWLLYHKHQLRNAFEQVVPVFIFGLPLLIYDFWVANNHPVLRIWNAQNLTPSPALGDLLLSLSPALLVGLWGLVIWVKSTSQERYFPIRTLAIWMVLGSIAIYLPFGLQRRFMMGIYVPVAGLAALGVESLVGRQKILDRFLPTVLVFLSLPTNLVILMAAFSGIQTRDVRIYLTRDEIQTLAWISAHTDPEDVILASPEMGLFIPAYTGRRVVYGHPFETVRATEQEQAVLDFFQANNRGEPDDALLANQDVAYVFLGERENILGKFFIPAAWEMVFQVGDVNLYRVRGGIP